MLSTFLRTNLNFTKSIDLGFSSPAIMAPPAASGSGLFKFIRPGGRLQSTDVQAAALWGVAAGSAALYLVQPFDWLRKTFFEKAEPEEK